jgi:hypothetical protein
MKEKPRKQNAIKAFQFLAREYCRAVVALDGRTHDEFLTKIASILGELYSVALLLPDVFPSTNRNRQSKRKVMQHTKRYKYLNDLLATKLGAANCYWKVFDPPDKKSLVSAALSDDLADICLDLEDGLALRRNGVRRNDFLWQWRFDFRAHWGRHAVSALAAIHHVIAWDYERGSD